MIMNNTNNMLFTKRALTIWLIFSVTLLLVLTSCKNDIEKRLSQKGNMWYLYTLPISLIGSQDSTSKYLVGGGFGCFKFNDNGELQHLVYNHETNQYVEYVPVINDVWRQKLDDKWHYNETKNELFFWGGKCKVLAIVEDTLLLESHDLICVLVNLGEEYPKNPNNRARERFDRSDIIRLLKQGKVPNDTIEKYIILDSLFYVAY